MDRIFFLKTGRLGFSEWTEEDLPLAELLWGDPEVSRYISARGGFTAEEIGSRLRLEIVNGRDLGVQYWPVFLLEGGEFAGCCGLRPRAAGVFELGFHLRPKFWGRGLASEAARAAAEYAFGVLGAVSLFAGHNPDNLASARVLKKLGFRLTGEEFYAPTGLMHPSYELVKRDMLSV